MTLSLSGKVNLRVAVDAEGIAVFVSGGHFLVNESGGSRQFRDGAGVVVPVGVECCLDSM